MLRSRRELGAKTDAEAQESMGKLFDRFRSVAWGNEAEVVQGFLYPLLTEVLGYRAAEILPEDRIPALKVPLNRSRSTTTRELAARPDFCLSLDGGSTFVGACDAKAPDQALTDHLDQIRAYANALTTTNLILITNGAQLAVYHGSMELLKVDSIADLDLHLSALVHLLGRDSVAKKSECSRLTTLASVTPISSHSDEGRQRNAVDVSDFRSYLRDVVDGRYPSMLVQGTLQAVVGSAQSTVPAELLHSFEEFDNASRPKISYLALTASDDPRPLVIIGDSGIGKSHLLVQICRDYAARCFDADINSVPLVVKLAHYTSAEGLEHLIRQTMAATGVPSSQERLLELLSQGRLALILDAFDEVFESDVQALERQLRGLIESFSSARIVVTTRPFRIPKIGSARRYSVLPLDSERIYRFVDHQIPERAPEFHWQLRKYRLERVASNTLVLAMLVNLLARGREVPRTRMKILRAIVEEVRAAEAEKPDRFRVSLPWSKIVLVLSSLAFESFATGDAYNLPSDAVRRILLAHIADFAAAGDIESGFTAPQLETVLMSTGFVVSESGGFVFWHRAFLEYFAAQAVCEQLDRGTLELASVISRAKWVAILPAAIASSKYANALALQAAGMNPLVALEALAEMDALDAVTTQQILAQAEPMFLFEYVDIRGDVMDAVSRLPGPVADEFVASLPQSAPLNVRMWALVESARRQLPGAHERVYARLEWDDYDRDSFSGAQDAVIEALGELGDRVAQRTLLSLWKSRREGRTGYSVSRQLAKLARHGLDQDVVNELLTWFDSDDIEYQKLSDLAPVIKALGSAVAGASIARRLARPLPGPDFSNRYVYTELAESIDDIDFALSYVDQANNEELPLATRRCFARALANSRANVPLEVYIQFTKHSDDHIRAEAFEALGRFRFRETEEVIGQALRVLQATPADGPGRPDLIQHAIVRALVAQGRLTVLLRDEYRPLCLYRFAHRAIVEAMGRQSIAELAPFVMSFTPDNTETRVLAGIALALGKVGEIELARDLRREALAAGREPYTESDLIEGCHGLQASEALEWLEIAWRASKPVPEDMRGFMEHQYVEALGRIGSPEARAILMQRIEQPDDLSEVIYDLSALRDLATPDLEEWLLGMFDRPHLQWSNVRCWVICILERVGTAEAIPTLLPLLKGSFSDVRQAAFRAIREIRARRDEVCFGT